MQGTQKRNNDPFYLQVKGHYTDRISLLGPAPFQHPKQRPHRHRYYLSVLPLALQAEEEWHHVAAVGLDSASRRVPGTLATASLVGIPL